MRLPQTSQRRAVGYDSILATPLPLRNTTDKRPLSFEVRNCIDFGAHRSSFQENRAVIYRDCHSSIVTIFNTFHHRFPPRAVALVPVDAHLDLISLTQNDGDGRHGRVGVSCGPLRASKCVSTYECDEMLRTRKGKKGEQSLCG